VRQDKHLPILRPVLGISIGWLCILAAMFAIKPVVSVMILLCGGCLLTIVSIAALLEALSRKG
jgi:hypothetical protein